MNETGISDQTSRELVQYQNSRSLTIQQSREIVNKLWPGAPEVEVYKAASICNQYGLNPLLKHVMLIPFKNTKTGGTDYAVVLGIGASRIIAQQERPYGYLDDTPRLMDEKEQVRIFGEVDSENLTAITIIKDKDGNTFRGYGKWSKADQPQGTNKGNTKANMAFIRSERQALAKLAPGKIPTNVEVMDESMVDEPKINISDVDTATGEVKPKSSINDPMCPLHNVPFKSFQRRGGGAKFLAHVVDGETTPDGKKVYCTPDKAEKAMQQENSIPAEVREVPAESPVVAKTSDITTTCPIHNKKWSKDAEGHLKHLTDDGVCFFSHYITGEMDELKPTDQQLLKDAAELVHKKVWSKLSEVEQWEYIQAHKNEYM